MKMFFSGKDKYGSYHLSIEDRVICAVALGAIGERLALRYSQDFQKLIKHISYSSWGHFADFSACDALTIDAKEESVKLHFLAQKAGCKVSAFILNSALLINQITEIRHESNLTEPLNQRIFSTKQECLDFIYASLSNESVKN